MLDSIAAHEQERSHLSLFPRIGYIMLALMLFGGAAFFRLMLPHEPFIDPDVGLFLGPALQALTDQSFQHSGGVSFGYPGFVYLILKTFRDFRAISIVQHLSGLAAGGILLACWNRSLRFIKKTCNSDINRLANLSCRNVEMCVAHASPRRARRTPSDPLRWHLGFPRMSTDCNCLNNQALLEAMDLT